MPTIKTLTLRASAVALTLGLAGGLAAPAAADDQYWSYVKGMVVTTNNQVPEIVVKNTAANHQLSSLNLTVQGSTIAVSIGGAVDCLGITYEDAFKRHGAFLSEGAFGIGRTGLLMKQDLPSSSDINHVSDMDAHTFQMPKNLLANPQIGLDPAALVLAAADKAPDRLKYLQQDHVIMATLPIRWESTCRPYTRYKVKKETLLEAGPTGSFMTKDVPVKIVYKGDPQLTNLNAQIANSVPAVGFKAGPQIPVIQSMTFQPNLPHHTGACPATTKIRVFYQGHGKGAVQITIADGNNIIANSGTKAFDGTDGQQYFDFEIQVPKATLSQLNKTVNHTLKASVRTRATGPGWDNAYTVKDTAVWKHRCTPQVNPAVGGGAVGGYKKNDNGGSTPSVIKRTQ